ncbi:hypothetical protein ABIC83_002632 [Roseateles asaccharophilus]|uniref:hypothetical protein n=1 Tax=Roseateles asaccharophilus TaxID=582607 RepID=UPI0038353DDC
MTRLTALLFASLLSPAAFAAGPSSASAPTFGQPLSCTADMRPSIFAVSKSEAVNAEPADLAWGLAAMKRIGFEASAPKGDQAVAYATVASSLARKGFIVAAKMARDEAARSTAAFRDSKFSASFEALVTVLTQPVAHASYPTSVRAEGESRGTSNPGVHSHGADLEDMSASLNEIIGRAEKSKQAMGKTYEKPAVRFYLLAQGFRDPIALKAAEAQVCHEKLDAETVRKLNISARFMAMPTRLEARSEASQ